VQPPYSVKALAHYQHINAGFPIPISVVGFNGLPSQGASIGGGQQEKLVDQLDIFQLPLITISLLFTDG
jgi:hypothetical protein